jgi:cytochrome c5
MKIMLLTGTLALASAGWGAAPAGKSNPSSTPRAQASARADNMRVEGERRFQANCGRCHAAPHKFPPRMMATIVRHMRVRATLTDEDMKLVLFYMTQ